MYGTVRYIQLNINAPSFIFHSHLRLQSKEKRLGAGGCCGSEHLLGT